MANIILKSTSADPVAVKQYCDKWTPIFRNLATETKNLSETLVKWMAFEQGTGPTTNGAKWTKEEEEQLKQALMLYGDDMDKICDALPLRTEQAIRAAVKRKMDPAMLQQIGRLKKRIKKDLEEDSSPLASYFTMSLNESKTQGPADGTDVQNNRPRHSPDKMGSTDTQKTGWFYQEAGVEMNDNDFLAILEDDPQVMEGAMIFTGIPAAPAFRIPDEPQPLLQEKYTNGQDFIFLHNFKMPLVELARELNVFKPISEEAVMAVEPEPAWITNNDLDKADAVENAANIGIEEKIADLAPAEQAAKDLEAMTSDTVKKPDIDAKGHITASSDIGSPEREDVISEENALKADLELAAAIDEII